MTATSHVTNIAMNLEIVAGPQVVRVGRDFAGINELRVGQITEEVEHPVKGSAAPGPNTTGAAL